MRADAFARVHVYALTRTHAHTRYAHAHAHAHAHATARSRAARAAVAAEPPPCAAAPCNWPGLARINSGHRPACDRSGLLPVRATPVITAMPNSDRSARPATWLPLGRAGLPLGRAGLPLGRAGLPLGPVGLPLGRAGLPLGRAGLPLGRAGLKCAAQWRCATRCTDAQPPPLPIESVPPQHVRAGGCARASAVSAA
jgi:hypothetical protein